MAVRLTFNTLLLMLYLYFCLIYLFHVIPSLCLSSGPFTDPQQLFKQFLNFGKMIFKTSLSLFVNGFKYCYPTLPIWFNIICLHTVKCLNISIWMIDRTLVLPFQARVNLGVIAMKGYSTCPKVPGLKPHHHIV